MLIMDSRTELTYHTHGKGYSWAKIEDILSNRFGEGRIVRINRVGNHYSVTFQTSNRTVNVQLTII